MSNHPFRSNIILFKSYINDLFFLWRGDATEAEGFVELLNSNTWGIKFTPNFNQTKILFLDLLITHDEYEYITCTFFKKVDLNSYFEFTNGITINGSTVYLMANLGDFVKIVQEKLHIYNKPK